MDLCEKENFGIREFGIVIKEYPQFPFSCNRGASSSLAYALRHSFCLCFTCFCFIPASLFSLGKELLSFHFYLAIRHGTKLSESKLMQCFGLHFTKALRPGASTALTKHLVQKVHRTMAGSEKKTKRSEVECVGVTVTKRKKPWPIWETCMSVKYLHRKQTEEKWRTIIPLLAWPCFFVRTALYIHRPKHMFCFSVSWIPKKHYFTTSA